VGFSAGDTIGDYVIEERLGAGGFGEVFRAAERSPRRLVALKFVRPEFAADPVFMRRFENEVAAMAAVAHPHVVPIYDAHGQEQGLPYFVMRYVPGGSLDVVLEQRRPAFEDVVDVLAGVAEGLDFCHSQGVVHRDLKPANVLVDSDRGYGLLADFGIAHADDFSTLTGSGKLLGTVAYMAPETLMGAPATAASDLWALGAVAYRAATNTLPRGREQLPDTPLVPPSRRDGRLGRDVDRVILRALSPDPARRYGDARAFVSDLREALDRPAHRTASTRPLRRSPVASPRRRAPRFATKRSLGVAGAAFVLAPIAVAYGVASLNDRPACHPSYEGACLKVGSGDYDCKPGDGNGPNYVDRPVNVVGPDEYGLDKDRDGTGC
jgi:serine/threonine-protein kinase